MLSSDELDGIFNRKDVLWMNVQDFTERFKRKIACQEMLGDYLSSEGIPPQTVSPSAYIDIMKIMLLEYEEQKAKEEAKPARKPRAKKLSVTDA